MLIESFINVIENKHLKEIIIVDDCSDPDIYKKLQWFCKGTRKIKLHRNQLNLGMSLNKYETVKHATSEWCIVFDSDNAIDNTYINAFVNFAKKHQYNIPPRVICLPEFAVPNFDYRAYSGKSLGVTNGELRSRGFIDVDLPTEIDKDPMLNCCMNTCNYIVNRRAYMDCFLEMRQQHPAIDVKGVDTIWFAYNWLRLRHSFYVLPGLRYLHRVHPGSGFMQDIEFNMRKGEEIKQMIMKL